MLHDPTIECTVSGNRRRRRAGGMWQCCSEGNQRFVKWENTCVNCPKDSTSRLGGYYCERNPEEEHGRNNSIGY